MNITLTDHAAELLEAARAQRGEPAELILEHALESFVREQQIQKPQSTRTAVHREAVHDILDFVKKNRVNLGPGLSAKDLIREGQRL